MALENVNKVCGQAFNIGGGFEQSLSLLELFDMLNNLLGIKMVYNQLPPRQSDFLSAVKRTDRVLLYSIQRKKVRRT